MTKPKTLTALEAVNVIRNNNNGQVVLVLQGGGALGAYQGGVYQALHEAGIEPDWIIGTSIGAINAAIITGNRPEDRLSQAAGVLAPGGARDLLGRVSGLGRRRRCACVMDDADQRHFRLLRDRTPAPSSAPMSLSAPTMPATTRPSLCARRWRSWSTSR